MKSQKPYQTFIDRVLKTLPFFVSGVRIILTPLFISLIANSRYLFSFLIFVAICISDLCDGLLARGLNVSSRFGSYVDLIADTIFVFISLRYLCEQRLLPFWVLVISILKLLEYVITSIFMSMRTDYAISLIYDKAGRAFGVMIFALPGIIVLMEFIFNCNSKYLNYYLGILVLLGGVSSFVRIGKCYRSRTIGHNERIKISCNIRRKNYE